jgi:hypothetical protein
MKRLSDTLNLVIEFRWALALGAALIAGLFWGELLGLVFA